MRHETNRERVEKLMVELGRVAREPGRIYFTGGVSAVLIGWREMTMDVDLKPDPEPEGIFEALPRLKDELEINIELASPDDFIPALEGWRDRSVFIARRIPFASTVSSCPSPKWIRCGPLALKPAPACRSRYWTREFSPPRLDVSFTFAPTASLLLTTPSRSRCSRWWPRVSVLPR